MNERVTSGDHIALAKALQAAPAPGNLAADILSRGGIDLEFYSPHLVDLQQPHERDELYVIARGSGTLVVEGARFPFTAGDVLSVPAGADHRFEAFSNDFATWVIFYGPIGGARAAS